MKIKSRFGLLVVLLSLCTLALPGVASAHRYYGGCCGHGVGVIYSQEDGRYYTVPDVDRNIAYRSVDGRYIPVMRYGYVCHRHHCSKHPRYVCGCVWPRVVCQTRCAHWEGPIWVADSKVCFYVR